MRLRDFLRARSIRRFTTGNGSPHRETTRTGTQYWVELRIIECGDECERCVYGGTERVRDQPTLSSTFRLSERRTHNRRSNPRTFTSCRAKTKQFSKDRDDLINTTNGDTGGRNKRRLEGDAGRGREKNSMALRGAHGEPKTRSAIAENTRVYYNANERARKKKHS